MKITRTSRIFFAHDAKTDLKAHGWGKVKDTYITGNFALVVPFLDACDEAAKKDVVEWVQKRQKAVAASVAADVDMDIPCPPGLAYRPYQKAGIAFMHKTRASLNGDVPRLGKTIMSLGVVNTHEKRLRVLVVCPAVAKINWCEEAAKWLVVPHAIGYAEGNDVPDVDFLVINYDILDRHKEYLQTIKWDIVVADEAHFLKNGRAKRTKAFFSIPAPTLHALFLTGTPMTRQPVDLWPMLQVLDPKDLGANFWRFAQAYCGASDANGWDTTGSKNEEQLQRKMRTKFMIRRDKTDLGADFPDVVQVVRLPASGLTEKLADETDAISTDGAADRIAAVLRETDERLKERGPDLTRLYLDNAADAYLSLTRGTREQLARRKAKMVVEFCKEQLSTEDKIVVFGHHRRAIDAIAEGLEDYNPVVIKGGLSTVERDGLIKAFKNYPEVRVAVVNMLAGGMAISLKEADVAVFAELGANGTIMQAKERIWDLTKESPVALFFLIVEKSDEEGSWQIYKTRQEVIDKITQFQHISLPA